MGQNRSAGVGEPERLQPDWRTRCSSRSRRSASTSSRSSSPSSSRCSSARSSSRRSRSRPARWRTTCSIGDHLLVNKFVFGPTRRAARAHAAADRHIKRGDVVVFKFPEEPERDFIKRVDRAARRDARAAQQEGLRQRQAARRAVRPLPAAAARADYGEVRLRRARALRPGHGAAGPLLRDGRQPRQLGGQPLLGFPAGATSRAGRVHLLVVRRAQGTRWGRMAISALTQLIPAVPARQCNSGQFCARCTSESEGAKRSEAPVSI